MKIQYVIAIHLIRWLTNFYDFRFKWTATAAIGIPLAKVWLSQLVNFKNAIWTLKERYEIKFSFKLEKNVTRCKLYLLLRPRDRETNFPVEECWLFQTEEGQTGQIYPQIFMITFFDSTDMIYMDWVPIGQTVQKEYYVEVLREFRKRFHRKRPVILKSGKWHFQQDNAPVHNSILVTDYLTRWVCPHRPYSPDLALCDFGYSLRSEAVVMRQLKTWKRLWRRSLTRSHKRTSMGPSRSCWTV